MTERPSAQRRGTVLSGRWLVTFADLSAVMVAFFVLMFSMSEVDIERWDGAAQAFNRRFNVLVDDVPSVRPQADTNVQPVESVPATDVSYLAALLERRLAGTENLRPLRLTLFSHELIISAAPEDLFAGDELSRQGRDILFALSGLLGAVRNGLNIVVHRSEEDETEWSESIARAALIADALRGAGYPHPIQSIGFGQRRDPVLPRSSRLPVPGRVDIVIAEDQEAR